MTTHDAAAAPAYVPSPLDDLAPAAAAAESLDGAEGFLYIRRSSKALSEDVSPAIQERKCRAAAAMDGVTITRVFSDLGRSGWDPAVVRDGWNECVRAAQSDAMSGGATRVIYGYRQDRISRQGPDEMSAIERALVPLGVHIRGADDGYDTRRKGMAAIGNFVTSTLSREESERISQRVSEARREERRRGAYTGGRPPYGYEIAREMRPGLTKPHRTLTPREDEAAIIRRVVAAILSGDSFASQVRALNDEGILTREGKLWSPPRLRVVIKNPAIAGFLVRHIATGQWHIMRDESGDYRRGWPGIIDEPSYWNLRRKLDARYDPRPSKRHFLTGRGLLICNNCGGPLCGVKASERRGGQYRCSRMYDMRPGKRCERGVTLEMAAVDAWFRDLVLSTARNLDPTNVEDYALIRGMARAFNASKADPSVKARRASISSELAAIERRLFDLDDARMSGEYDGAVGLERYRRMSERLNAMHAKARAALADLPDESGDDIDGVLDWISDLFHDEARAVDDDTLFRLAGVMLSGVVVMPFARRRYVDTGRLMPVWRSAAPRESI